MRNYCYLHLNLVSRFNEAGTSVCLQGPPQAIETGTAPGLLPLVAKCRADVPLCCTLYIPFLKRFLFIVSVLTLTDTKLQLN